MSNLTFNIWPLYLPSIPTATLNVDARIYISIFIISTYILGFIDIFLFISTMLQATYTSNAKNLFRTMLCTLREVKMKWKEEKTKLKRYTLTRLMFFLHSKYNI